MDRRGDYSTLEVVDHPNHDTNKMVVQDHSDLPQVVSPSHGQYKPPEDQGGYYAAHSQVGGHSPYQHSAYHSHYQDTEHATTPYPGEEKPAGKRICGLAAKTFWIIAVIVAILVIGAIVGGAVGATVGKSKNDNNNGNGNGNGANATNPATVLSVDSRISAVNWTDANKVSHYALFSQDKTNSILVSLWDSSSKTWNPLNITKLLADGGTPVSVKAGSPVAGAVSGDPYKFQLNVYYLTPSNGIGEIITLDPTFKVWSSGDLNKQSPKIASSNSQLTAIWNRCDKFCSNEVNVMYEDAGNNMALLNSSDWTKTLSVTDNELDSGAAMTLIPFIFNGGKNGSYPGELRFYSNTGGGDVHEWLFSIDQKWYFGRTMVSGLKTTPPPQLAASPFGGWEQILLVQRNQDGTIVGSRWDASSWVTNQRMQLQGGPANGSPSFDYIAMNNDGRFYGTVKGEIHEYSWTIGDPYTFLYVGTVKMS